MNLITRELTAPCKLCDAQGNLDRDALGWSRQPHHIANLRGRRGRKKRWDYWCILTESHLMAITLAHLDYISLASVDVLVYDGGRHSATAAVKPFGSNFAMGETVNTEMHFQSKNLEIVFAPEGPNTVIRFKAGRLGDAAAEGNFRIERPQNHETLNVVIPWDNRRFQFTSKQTGLPAQGEIIWANGQTLAFGSGAWAVLDYGRGIWPWRTTWNWGTCFEQRGDTWIGLNLGGQWTDGTGATENGIVLNGRLHKIFEDVIFKYDPSDFMLPWRIHTRETDTIKLDFIPFYEKASRLELGIIGANAHQCFGHYQGSIMVDGQQYPVDHALGWAEEMQAKW